MSGIVGILNVNGATVEQEMLERLTDFMSYRGPDASSVWANAAVGLGHTMLRTTAESAREQQPCSIDGEVWISADARIDGRADLLAELRSTETFGRAKPDLASLDDARLILYAYHAWGENCLSRLIGDFAFIIWDGRRRQLFCACDHLGVKPFYYAAPAECIVMSNTLNCIKTHPAVSAELNDLAVADFLLFDYNQEPDTTTFKEIRRLPPAHSLTWSARGMQVSCYWKPPLDGRIRYRKTKDYIEHYKDLLRQATNDRLRADRVSIFMSGGLDSTSVAAAATQIASGAGTQSSLKAFATVFDQQVFDQQVPDRERHYSGLAAEALGIPIEHLPADGLKLFQDLDGPEAMSPEPFHDPMLALSIRRLRRASLHSRVALTGQGGDVVFRYSPPSILSWAFGRLLLSSWRYAARYRRVPRLGLRTGLKKLWHGKQPQDMNSYPCWLNQDLERHLRLRDRWEWVCGDRPRLHPFRPDSYSLLGASSWRVVFETYDPGWTHFPIEFRHPLFDTRLVTYLLSLPNEIFFDKIITREAMKGYLPEPVRARPKTPLAADPMRGQADRFQEIMREFIADPKLAKYVNLSAIPRRAEPADDFNGFWLNLRPVSFNLWLRRSACEA